MHRYLPKKKKCGCWQNNRFFFPSGTSKGEGNIFLNVKGPTGTAKSIRYSEGIRERGIAIRRGCI